MTLNKTKSKVPESSAVLTLENEVSLRILHEEEDKREEICKLSKPALSHECNLWNLDNLKDMNLEELPDEPANNSNFEDYLGFYTLL